MILITHITFNSLFYLLSIAFFNQDFNLLKLILINIGGFLPDIDTRFSFIGRIFSPISTFIEIKYGHRTITHSLLFIFLIYCILFPLKFFNYGEYTNFVLFGILGHILLDSCNKQGVLLFYPNITKAVFPRKEELRIAVNSDSEKTLLVILLILLLISIPFSQVGFFRSLHLLLKDYDSAVLDYKKFSNEGFEVFANIDGFDKITKQSIKQKFKVIDLINNDLLIENKNILFLINNKNDSDISIKKIKIITGSKIKIVLQKVILQNIYFKEILQLKNNNKQFLIGEFKTDQDLNFINDDFKFTPIKVQGKSIKINYATFNDLKNFNDIIVINGIFYIKNEIKNINEFNNISKEIILTNKIINTKKTNDIKIKLNSLNELKIKEKQNIKKGELIAIIQNKDLKELEILNKNLKDITEKIKDIKNKKENIKNKIIFLNERLQYFTKKYNTLEKMNTENEIKTINNENLILENDLQNFQNEIEKINHEKKEFKMINKIYSFIDGFINEIEVNQNNEELIVTIKILP